MDQINNTKSTYSERFRERALSPHNYPGEWVIRTLLGNYPELKTKMNFKKSSKVLDLGFGDGRNWSLLNNMELAIFGVDISSEIIESGYIQANKLGISDITLSMGRNSHIPFGNDYFDLILASNSFYYIDKDVSFEDHLKEISRVGKKDSVFVASLPRVEKNFLFKNASHLENGIYLINNDPHLLRNGYRLRGFNNKNEIKDVFDDVLYNISIAHLYSDYFNYEISQFIITGNLK